MAWATASNKASKPLPSFRGLRWRLLLSYLSVMAAILGVFGAGIYVFFSRSLNHQLDKRLLTLAQSAAPSLAQVKANGSGYLNQVDEVPWRDIFNRDQQSLEWFNADGELLASKGALSLAFPPAPGLKTLRQPEEINQRVRTLTISIYKDGTDPGQPTLEGYIRASQSTESVEVPQHQLLWGLGVGGILALGLIGVGGLWLTQKALEPTEKSLRQLKQFTADASHELRSPLTAIKTSVDVILNHPERIHAKNARKLAAIASATSQMSHLVEDLLFLARLDTIASLPERERGLILLHQILQQVVELFEPSAQGKGITLESRWLAQVSVVGDKVQLTRLFANLLENALQYTASGGTILLLLERHHRFAVVSIRDTGIGIDPEHLPHIFDRFWRADQGRISCQRRNMGLGLSIVQAITQQHGGRITVNSQVGVGSCFQVYLPVVQQPHSSHVMSRPKK